MLAPGAQLARHAEVKVKSKGMTLVFAKLTDCHFYAFSV